jgi:hypothetical protein
LDEVLGKGRMDKNKWQTCGNIGDEVFGKGRMDKNKWQTCGNIGESGV